MKFANVTDCAHELLTLDASIYRLQILTGEAFEYARPELSKLLRRRSRVADELAIHQASSNGKLAHHPGNIRQRLQREQPMSYREYCATLPADDYLYNDVVMQVVAFSVRLHDRVHAVLWRINPTVAMEGTRAVLWAGVGVLYLLQGELGYTEEELRALDEARERAADDEPGDE